MSAKVSERAFQNQVIALARTCGWSVMHTRPAVMRSGKWATPLIGDPGYPDLTLAHPDGLIVFAELKVPGNKPTAHQERWLSVLDVGGPVEVRLWTPADWPEIQQVLAYSSPKVSESKSKSIPRSEQRDGEMGE